MSLSVPLVANLTNEPPLGRDTYTLILLACQLDANGCP